MRINNRLRQIGLVAYIEDDNRSGKQSDSPDAGEGR